MKYPMQDLTRVPEREWIRLAAFIDGEGSIGTASTVHRVPRKSGRTHYEYIKITVTNTDIRLSRWAALTFGGNVQDSANNKKRNPRWKPCYFWSLTSERAAAVLRGCLPYLLLKADQAEVALAIQATMSRCGVRGTPQSVIDHRAVLRAKLHVLNARGPRKHAAVS